MNGFDELKSLDVEILGDIQLRESKLGGTGVFANKHLNEGDVIMRIPKESVLSPKTCAAANIISEFQNKLEPQDLLVACYLFEKSQGSESPWHQFIDIAENATQPDVFLLWTPEEQKMLKNTNLDVWQVPQLEKFQETYNETLPLFEKLTIVPSFKIPTFDEYLRTSLIISSRAFDVDNYHKIALVPGACFFNHSDREHVHFEATGDVCEICGEIECDCIYSDSEDEEIEEIISDMEFEEDEDEEEEGDDQQLNEENDVASVVDMDDADVDNDSSCDECDDDDDGDRYCELRLISPVSKGSEIFNTYGQDPNGVLLNRYGFAIWNNKHDVVDFDKETFTLAQQFDKVKELEEWLQAQEDIADTMDQDSVKELDDSDSEFENDQSGDSDEIAFLGLINDNNDTEIPRASAGLIELADRFQVDLSVLIQALADLRLKKYYFTEDSKELYAKSKKEVGRKQAAMVVVASEKNIIERYIKLAI